jgi:hypothetical protein
MDIRFMIDLAVPESTASLISLKQNVVVQRRDVVPSSSSIVFRPSRASAKRADRQAASQVKQKSHEFEWRKLSGGTNVRLCTSKP